MMSNFSKQKAQLVFFSFAERKKEGEKKKHGTWSFQGQFRHSPLGAVIRSIQSATDPMTPESLHVFADTLVEISRGHTKPISLMVPEDFFPSGI